MVGKCKKKGIMGGTFDPIHIGHLILGENACLQLGLDSILFMPSGNPPHKPHRPGRATTMQRVEMVRLAIEDNPHFELSLAETHDQGYTYTEETLRRLTAENPDTDYYFIMGADSLFQFEHWKRAGGNLPPGHSGGGCPGSCFREKTGCSDSSPERNFRRQD